MKKGEPSLDVSDANATTTDVLSPKTFYAGADPEKKIGTITQDTDLSAVDPDLASANIKSGITIFGKIGSADVRDVSDADALVGEVKAGKTFYAVGGARKTGTLPTESLNPASEEVSAGYYAATTLSAVDGDLITGSIKSGVTIFGVEGHADVRDVSDADAAITDVLSGKTFYAVGGARKTGTLTAGNPAYDTAQEDDDDTSDNYAMDARETLTLPDGSEVVLITRDITPSAISTLVAFASITGVKGSVNMYCRIYIDDTKVAEYSFNLSGTDAHCRGLMGYLDDQSASVHTVQFRVISSSGASTFLYAGAYMGVAAVKAG